MDLEKKKYGIDVLLWLAFYRHLFSIVFLAVIMCANLCSWLEVPLMKPEGYTSL